MPILMWAPHEQGHTLFMAQSKVLAHAETGGLLRWLPKSLNAAIGEQLPLQERAKDLASEKISREQS